MDINFIKRSCCTLVFLISILTVNILATTNCYASKKLVLNEQDIYELTIEQDLADDLTTVLPLIPYLNASAPWHQYNTTLTILVNNNKANKNADLKLQTEHRLYILYHQLRSLLS